MSTHQDRLVCLQIASTAKNQTVCVDGEVWGGVFDVLVNRKCTCASNIVGVGAGASAGPGISAIAAHSYSSPWLLCGPREFMPHHICNYHCHCRLPLPSLLLVLLVIVHVTICSLPLVLPRANPLVRPSPTANDQSQRQSFISSSHLLVFRFPGSLPCCAFSLRFCFFLLARALRGLFLEVGNT